MNQIEVHLWLTEVEIAAGRHLKVQDQLRRGTYANCPGCWTIDGRDIALDNYRGTACRKVTLTLSPVDGIARSKAEQVRREQQRHARDKSSN